MSCGQWISLPCDSTGVNADPKQPVKAIEDIWHNFLSTLEEEEALIVPRPATPVVESKLSSQPIQAMVCLKMGFQPISRGLLIAAIR